MQIITIADKDFDALVQAVREGREMGRYWKKGSMQVVCATKQFLIVTSEANPQKIAIKPARSLGEAEELALKLLAREEERGNQVERRSEYALA